MNKRVAINKQVDYTKKQQVDRMRRIYYDI